MTLTSAASELARAQLNVEPSFVLDRLAGALRTQRSLVISGAPPPPDGRRDDRQIGVELTTLQFDQRALKNAPGIEVDAVLAVRKRGKGAFRFEVDGVGQALVAGPGLDEKQEAERLALDRALQAAAAAVAVRLEFSEKRSDQLLAELHAGDPTRREVALGILIERRDPVAVQPLLERLSSDNPVSVRRAIGDLVDLKATRAVPALIDLARQKDAVALREILFALGAIGGEEAQAYLYTVSQGHDHPEIREVAQQALDELNASAARVDSGSARGEAGNAR